MNILGKTAIARLALHQSQRCQAIPTLSVLQGKAIAARQLWTQWSKQTERSTGVGVYTSIAALLETWVAGMALQGRSNPSGAATPTTMAQYDDLRSRILQNVATLANRPATELTAWLAHTSDYQRQLFWQQLAPLSEDGERTTTGQFQVNARLDIDFSGRCVVGI